MRPGLLLVAVLVPSLFLAGAGCRGRLSRGADPDSSELASREARLNLARRAGGADTVPLARWVLPPDLAEASGLALSPDGRLFSHPDERGIVSEIDYRRGVVVKQFLLGRRGVQADFEGMAIVGDTMYLLASNGRIYEFREGANGAHVDHSIHDLELGKECEFEGLAYDSTIGSLLLPCKHVGVKELQDHLVIYRWRLSETGGERLSRVATPVTQLEEANAWKEFRPTGIEVDPLSGNYVLVTAERALIIVSKEGEILATRQLPVSHDQPEGVAITADSILIISDEAVTRPATITLYRWP
jgi:uncharacterized protein YjiK